MGRDRKQLLLIAFLSSFSLQIHAFVGPHRYWHGPRQRQSERHRLHVSLLEPDVAAETEPNYKRANDKPNVVLVTGFESFNRDLYYEAAANLPLNLTIFSDAEIRTSYSVEDDLGVNPKFRDAVLNADAFIGSLIFDYDDALVVQKLLPDINGPRLIFESATELMTFNRVGTFSMEPKGDGPAGPPPAIKAILSKFSSGKEEDKISGYLKLLKIGPTLLKYVPGEKAGDLRTWLEAYRYWNQGGKNNVAAMLKLIADRCKNVEAPLANLPELEVTPDVGLLHPLKDKDFGSQRFFDSPASYINWRLSSSAREMAKKFNFKLAPSDAPRVAVLLYRKHVITEQRYVWDLLTMMEEQDLIPVPIFINGVEAHTIVRDMLTSKHEIEGVARGTIVRDTTYQAAKAIPIDAIVNTIGFPLVGGPAGSVEAGRNVDLAKTLLRNMNIPYVIGSPLLLQSIPQWKLNGVLGLQSVALYSLPELDGAIDTVVLGGLVGDKIALVPERVRKLTSRIKGWVNLRRTPPSQRKVAIMLYGFPPNVGAVGTAALLDVPSSLEALLKRLAKEGYDVGDFANDPESSGQSLVAALSILSENPVITAGVDRMQDAINAKIERAVKGDSTVAETLARGGGGLGGSIVNAKAVTMDELERVLGKYMTKKVHRAWDGKERGPGVSAKGELIVAGLQVGNVWISVQPLLGVEGDPMRLLFERDLTPHPQYCAAYEYMRLSEEQGGFGAQCVIHLGMHGTVEWLPGRPLGNDRQSWSDELLGSLPNVYVYAANNPSESILAKRRGYGTLVSYNVPPYGRAGLYLELANLKELLDEYRNVGNTNNDRSGSNQSGLRDSIWSCSQKTGLFNDVPLLTNPDDKDTAVTGTDLPETITDDVFNEWVVKVSDYLLTLQDRLFSSGLHVLGDEPTDDQLVAYVEAYFGQRLEGIDSHALVSEWRKTSEKIEVHSQNPFSWLTSFIGQLLEGKESVQEAEPEPHDILKTEVNQIVSLLSRSTEELDSVVTALDGGYVEAAPGGDLLRDGPSVLPTGRNIHALDPYRMPSAGAWARGQKAAAEILKQHTEANGGAYPETVAVTLWGLDAIKTRGESVAIVLALVGAKPVKEGTGRIVRYDLIPLQELGRPRVDVLASLSGIFRYATC